MPFCWCSSPRSRQPRQAREAARDLALGFQRPPDRHVAPFSPPNVSIARGFDLGITDFSNVHMPPGGWPIGKGPGR